MQAGSPDVKIGPHALETLIPTLQHEFQRHGQLTFEEIEVQYDEIVNACGVITELVKSGSVSAGKITNFISLMKSLCRISPLQYKL